MPDLHPSSQINVATLCPDNYRIACGTDTPSASLFNFETGVPTNNFYGVNTEITALRFHGRSSQGVLLGTYGGTIVNWDIE
jgi:WD40 repeat protein